MENKKIVSRKIIIFAIISIISTSICFCLLQFPISGVNWLILAVLFGTTVIFSTLAFVNILCYLHFDLFDLWDKQE